MYKRHAAKVGSRGRRDPHGGRKGWWNKPAGDRDLAWGLGGDGKPQGVIWQAGKNAWALRDIEHWQEQVAVGQGTARSETGQGGQAMGAWLGRLP
jgi:hypothetical protein